LIINLGMIKFVKYNQKYRGFYIDCIDAVNLCQSCIVKLEPGHIIYSDYTYLMMYFIIFINSINI